MNNRAKIIQYDLRLHSPLMVSNDLRYCRMANEVIPFTTRRCETCPLWNGEIELVMCQYYDLEAPIALFSEEEKKRTTALIALGLSEEFPQFVDGKAWPEEAMIYEKAVQFAARAHKGSYRKGTHNPYIVHPVEASGIVRMMFLEKMEKLGSREYEVMAAAVLHDTVEDTNCTISEIEREFGAHVAALVAEESEDKRRSMKAADSWRIRKEEALDKLRHASEEAKMIAMGDKLSNMYASAGDHRKIGDQMWEKFNQKDKNAQEWYYREIAEALSCFKESFAYKRFIELSDEVFTH